MSACETLDASRVSTRWKSADAFVIGEPGSDDARRLSDRRPTSSAAAVRIAGAACSKCTAPDLLDTERDAVIVIHPLASGKKTAFWGDTEVAAPLINSPL